MDNLRGRLGSTRKTKRGRGCDAASSSFDPAKASAMQAHFRPELTGSAPKTFGECGRYFAGCIEGTTNRTVPAARSAHGCVSDLKSRKTNDSEPSLVGGVGVSALGMLTITGSNMHRGIEMPVAQPYYFGCELRSGPHSAGRYSKTDERHIGRQRSGLSLRTVGATSWSGDSKAYWPVSALSNTAPHCYRNHGNPYIGKGMHTRSQQIFLAGAGWAIVSLMLMRGMQPWPSVCIPQFLEAGRPVKTKAC